MGHGQRDPGRQVRLGSWTQQQEDDFDLGQHILSMLVGTCAARIVETDDAGEAARLRAVQARYAAERRALVVTDDEAVARVLAAYPAVLRALERGEQA